LKDGKAELSEIKKQKISDIDKLLNGFRKRENSEKKDISFSYLLFQGELLKCVLNELAETDKFLDIIKANMELN
jgi:hypothetical protein